MDTGRSLNSRDGFPRRKFKNRAPTSCSPGLILRPPTISFEIHAKPLEEIDLENSQIWKLRDLDLRLGRGHTGVHMWSRSTYTPNYMEIGKTFCGRTDTPEFQSTMT